MLDMPTAAAHETQGKSLVSLQALDPRTARERKFS